ncbi:MAG: glycosyltransferase 87 family protein, partial [Candidatus Thorarchaeota archaeon]
VNSTTKNFEKTLTFLFIAPQHIVNIMFGQITQLSILVTIIALFILRTKQLDKIQWFFVVGLLIGLAATIKPFFIVFIPFMVPISRGGRFGITISFRHLIGVTTGILCVMVPNLLYFILYPNAINEFIQINLVQDLTGQHSTSLTKLILAFIDSSDAFLIQIGIIIIVGGIIFFKSYYYFVQSPENQKEYQRHFTDMVFLILLVYPDSWFLFIAVWYAFLAPSMLILYNSTSISNDEMKKLDILWSGSNNLLAFFSIGIVLHYLVLGFDPIIPIWLLILWILYQRVETAVEKQEESVDNEPTSL